MAKRGEMRGERGVFATHIMVAENTPGFRDLFWPGWPGRRNAGGLTDTAECIGSL